MPNPYEDLFEEQGKNENQHDRNSLFSSEESSLSFDENAKEPLDEILEAISVFNSKAEHFAKLLSRLKVVDHKVDSGLVKLFVEKEDKYDKGSLKKERQYHELLASKFTAIIEPMRSLAELHLSMLRQFDLNIDKNYYSVEKTDKTVRSEKADAIDGINLQRKILAEATSNLDLLVESLRDSEKRLRDYVDVGGMNNISNSEFEFLIQKRELLTSGRTHQFDYSFFNFNFLDKTVISLGIYMKETTSQYLGRLRNIFE